MTREKQRKREKRQEIPAAVIDEDGAVIDSVVDGILVVAAADDVISRSEIAAINTVFKRRKKTIAFGISCNTIPTAADEKNIKTNILS